MGFKPDPDAGIRRTRWWSVAQGKKVTTKREKKRNFVRKYKKKDSGLWRGKDGIIKELAGVYHAAHAEES